MKGGVREQTAKAMQGGLKRAAWNVPPVDRGGAENRSSKIAGQPWVPLGGGIY